MSTARLDRIQRMQPQLSQQTLGLLRRILEDMQPDDALTPYENRRFWKDALFDGGLSPSVIDMAAAYNFVWGDIIPDLFVGKFGRKIEPFSSPVSPSFCEAILNNLLKFALRDAQRTPLAGELRRSLASDGFGHKESSGADSSLPVELEQIPRKSALISDLQGRLDKDELLAVLFMDLDGFKAVNDTMSHDAGDKCLVKIALVIKEAILGKGKLYRYGGDEFICVLPNFSHLEAASTAERIRASIENANAAGQPRVTVSIGVVGSNQSKSKDAHALIKLADETMYVAKRQKNTVFVAAESD